MVYLHSSAAHNRSTAGILLRVLAPVIDDVNPRVEFAGSLGQIQLDALQNCFMPPHGPCCSSHSPWSLSTAALSGLDTRHHDGRLLQFFDGRLHVHDLDLLYDPCAGAADGAKILGVTDLDLFIPVFTFVFGEAQLGGCAALISTRRLRQEFYGLPPDTGLLFTRAEKEAVHELRLD